MSRGVIPPPVDRRPCPVISVIFMIRRATAIPPFLQRSQLPVRPPGKDAGDKARSSRLAGVAADCANSHSTRWGVHSRVESGCVGSLSELEPKPLPPCLQRVRLEKSTGDRRLVD
jgi:hypothetical protein